MTRFAAALTLALAATTACAGQLTVGFGAADITPALGKASVYVAGFGPNRPATAVHDPLHARAVVLGDGTTTVSVVSVDVVGLFLPTVEAVRARLPGVGHVADHVGGLATVRDDLGDQADQPRLTAGGDQDPGATASQPDRGLPADATGRADDDDDLGLEGLQLHLHGFLGFLRVSAPRAGPGRPEPYPGARR